MNIRGNANTDIREIFRGLATPQASSSGTPVVQAAGISTSDRLLLGKVQDGRPLLLIQTDNDRPSSADAYRHVEVQYGRQLRLVREQHPGVAQGTFTVVECLSNDPDLQEYFLRFLEIAVEVLAPPSSSSDIAGVIETIVELFKSLEHPSSRTVRGLWAELCLITLSTDPAKMVSRWHATPGEAYDFASGQQYLEIKSTGGDTRTHSFSLRQLSPPADTQVVVASLVARESVGGSSIEDLIEELAPNIDAHARRKVWQVALSTLGSDWPRGAPMRFDVQIAKDSLRFFDAINITRIDPVDCPPNVSGVHFTSDLSNTQCLSIDDLRDRGGLLFAVLPRS